MVTGKSASTVAKAPQQPPQPGADKKLGAGQMNGAPAKPDEPEKPAPQDQPTPPQTPEKPDEPVHAAAAAMSDLSVEAQRQQQSVATALAKKIIDLYAALPAQWGKLSENERKYHISCAQQLAVDAIEQLSVIQASNGYKRFTASIPKFEGIPADDKGSGRIAAKIILPYGHVITDAIMSGQRLTVVLADISKLTEGGKKLTAGIIGPLQIPEPEPKINEPVPGHAIKLEETGDGADKMKVATCECGTWKSSIGIADADKLGPVIAAHLEQARAQAKVGRGPVDAQGNPVNADAKTGEVVEREIDKTATQRTAEANQAMPGDIGPATPPAKPTEPA